MSKIYTTGKRVLLADGWHDDNGPIPFSDEGWEPPMTDDEVMAAALADPDAQPLTEEQLARMRPIAAARRIRRKMRMSLDDFAAAYDIPAATLRAWERHEAEPTPAEAAYLRAIENAPDAVRKALAPA